MIHPMSVFTVFHELFVCHKSCQNPIRSCRRHSAQFLYIDIRDVVMRFEIVLNLVPAERGLIQRSIAHFINQYALAFERCFRCVAMYKASFSHRQSAVSSLFVLPPETSNFTYHRGSSPWIYPLSPYQSDVPSAYILPVL